MASTYDSSDLFGAAPPSGGKVEEKKAEGVLLFDDLKIGMHVKARCGCTGFVRAMSESESESPWLDIVYTDCPCKSLRNVKLLYEAQIPFQASDIYSGSVFSSVFPVTAIPAPDWYPSLEKGPVKGSPKLAVRVKMPISSENGYGMMSFLIPSELANVNIYEISISLRRLFSQLSPEIWKHIEIEVVESGDFKDTLKKDVEKTVMGSPMSVEQKNMASLKEEVILASIRSMVAGGADKAIVVGGEVPLSKGSAVDAILEAKKSSEFARGMFVKMTCRTKDESSMFTVSDQGKVS